MFLKKFIAQLPLIFRFVCLCLCLLTASEAKCPSAQKSPMADAGKRIYGIGIPAFALLRGDVVGAVTSAVIIHGFYKTNALLENRIGKKRPCGCNGAFPSGHTITMISGASFLFFRYGWKFGLPPMVVAFMLLSDRVACDAHSWADILGTALIYHLLTGIFVTRRGRRWLDKWQFLKRLFQRQAQPA